MSRKRDNKKAVQSALSAIDRGVMCGYSFEMPAAMYGELFRLSQLTGVPMAHYVREAMHGYFSSPEHIAHMAKLEARQAAMNDLASKGQASSKAS